MDFKGILVCDIYAGSGALGFEALSRGASKCHFVEKNFAVFKVLKQNVELLGSGDSCKIFKTEAKKFSSWEKHEKYDLILADPPFFKDDIYIVLENLKKNNYLSENGIVIIERSVQTQKEDVEAFGIEPIKKLGDSLIYQIDWLL
jgi:16S rRNA (guanine966-N2)-methyltransferase